MRYRRYLLNIVVVSLTVYFVSAAAAETPDSARYDVDLPSLKLQTRTYAYRGDGRFAPYREPHVVWISVRPLACSFDPSDSTLHLSGSLYDSRYGGEVPRLSYRAMVGQFLKCPRNSPSDSNDTGFPYPEDTTPPGFFDDSRWYCMDDWTEFHIDSADGFTVDTKVAPGSFLFIVPQVPDRDGSIMTMAAAGYKIGKLLERETYAEILRKALDADTLQTYLYRAADSVPYPVTIADDILSAIPGGPYLEKFGLPVTFLSRAAADSAGLPAYFWVIDYVQHGDEARIQLEDPVRHILFGASYTRSPSGWKTESTYMRRGL